MKTDWTHFSSDGAKSGGLQFHSKELSKYTWPVIEIGGVGDGPLLCVMAGVHINEASSIEAALMLAKRIDPYRLRGRISVLPIVNLKNLFRYTLAVAPDAGPDLHWTYPGDADGNYEEALANALLFEWAREADVLLDLHGGDLDEKMARYVVIQSTGDGVFDRKAEQLAHCYDTELVVALDKSAMDKRGRCCTALAGQRRLALVAEAGDQGSVDPQAVEWHVNGILNVARWLGMLPGESIARNKQICLDQYEWIVAPCDGIVERHYRAGQWLEKGEPIGVMRDLQGQTLCAINAPASGCVMMEKTTQLAPAGYWIGSIGVPRQ